MNTPIFLRASTMVLAMMLALPANAQNAPAETAAVYRHHRLTDPDLATSMV
jgi:hypothetical protein